MIHKLLPKIAKELNDFLRRVTYNKEEFVQVVLSEMMKRDDNVVEKEFRIICTLINVEQERTNLNMSSNISVKTNPPVHLNLYCLFSVDFPNKHYTLALKYLSYVIAFFQGKQVFTPQNTPDLPEEVEKITVEIVNLDVKELSNFWMALRVKHHPSILYKLRMISISGQMVFEEISEISQDTTPPKNK